MAVCLPKSGKAQPVPGGHGDHVAIGLKRKLAYEQGCHTFFWYRPAWRILRDTDTPLEVKETIREFIIQTGDRLAFCRTMAMVNGNALASPMAAASQYTFERGAIECEVGFQPPSEFAAGLTSAQARQTGAAPKRRIS